MQHTLLKSALISLLVVSNAALGADYNFDNRHGLDLINVKAAYDQGFTGKGVNVGVVDYPIATNPKLEGKVVKTFGYDLYYRELQRAIDDAENKFTKMALQEEDRCSSYHGTSVAGIIASNLNNDACSSGVAFEAFIDSLAMIFPDDETDKLSSDYSQCIDEFLTTSNVKVINNSWVMLLNISFEHAQKMQITQIYQDKTNIAAVFGAGNDGLSHPYFPVLNAYFSEKQHYLSVSSINAHVLSYDENGRLIVPPAGVSIFSNLPGKECALFSVMAPGSFITFITPATSSSQYHQNAGFKVENGTSFAAPYVSGTLALVQKKYPFLSARQLIDTVLTTANHDFKAPDFIISLVYNEEKEKVLQWEGSRCIRYFEFVFRILNQDMALPKTTLEAQQLLISHFHDDPNSLEGWSGDKLDFYLAYLEQDGTWSAERATFEEVFGQGILDAGKAIDGVARLDANRLSISDIVSVPELSQGYQAVLDTFDTKGHVAYFDNDIVERRWLDHYHYKDFQTSGSQGERAKLLSKLPVGLRKVGAGTLSLRGHSTFQGPCVVADGTLILAPRLDGTGGELETSVVVGEGGVFEAEGKVKEIFNHGLMNIKRTLEVNKFMQTASGTLHLTKKQSLNAKEAKLAGTLILDSDYDYCQVHAKLTFKPDFGGITKGTFDKVKVISSDTPTTELLNLNKASFKALPALAALPTPKTPANFTLSN